MTQFIKMYHKIFFFGSLQYEVFVELMQITEFPVKYLVLII